MSPQTRSVPGGIVGRLLAVVSLATFWLVPFSPLVAIAAVTATRQSSGWPQTLARLGAILCTVWIALLAVLVLWFAGLRLSSGSWAF